MMNDLREAILLLGRGSMSSEFSKASILLCQLRVSVSIWRVPLQLPYMFNSKMILAGRKGTDIKPMEN